MRAANVLDLGVKELRSLWRDPMLMFLIFYAFSVSIYTSATALPETLRRATIAIVDEDRSPLTQRIADAFYPPFFTQPVFISQWQMDARMNSGQDTFALDFPPGFQRDMEAGRQPAVQLNVDATRMTQAFTGSAYVQSIIGDEVRAFVRDRRDAAEPPVGLALRARFNPELNNTWFASVMMIIDHITMLSIILTGAAVIRERERGTLEHLLVMPVTPLEIMTSKVWAMGLVVLLAAAMALTVVVQGTLGVPVQGSETLFLAGVAVHLFATTSMGIFLGTLARSMPQFGLLLMLVLLPLMMLSGGATPRESMPQIVQTLMLAAPNTHFVQLSQAILYRGAGLDVVWPQFLAIAVIGTALFLLALARFRKAISLIG